MKRNQGFSSVVLLLLLALGLVVAVFLIGQQTGFFNQAAKLRTASDVSPWGNAVTIPLNPESHSYLVATNSSSLTNLPVLTVEAWIKPKSVDRFAGATIVSKQFNPMDSPPNWSFQITKDNYLALRYPVLYAGYIQSDVVTSNQKVVLDKWQHVRMTFSLGTVRLYIDGKYVGGGTASTENLGYEDTKGDASARNVSIGYDCVGRTTSCGLGMAPFDGEMDEVRLTNSDTCMSEESCPVPLTPFTSDDNTLALWHFDTNNPSSVGPNGTTPDSSSNTRGALYYGITQFVPSTVPYPSEDNHRGCVNQACILVPGAGASECSSDDECKIKQPQRVTLLINSGFEIDGNPKDTVPDGWIGRRLDKNDGMNSQKYEGNSSFRFSPYDAVANAKKDVKNELIRQSVSRLSGQVKDTITLKFWDRVTNFDRRNGDLAAAIVLKKGNKIVSTNGILVNTATSDWKEHTITTAAQVAYDTVVVNFYNTNTKSAWWLDAASLTIVPDGVATGIRPTTSTLPTSILQAVQEN